MTAPHTAPRLAMAVLALALGACENKPPTDPPPPVASAPSAPAPIQRQPAPAGARVVLLIPAAGAAVKSPVTVQFGVEGMTLAPAGSHAEHSGHHHLLVDADIPALDQPIPKDERHLHFGQAQTETQVELAAGQHTLQLLLGDGNHLPHDPPVASEQITITVE